MKTWEYLLGDLPLLVGTVLLILCGAMHFFPPKKINYLYGYRTTRSMKSEEAWSFAQKFSNRRMIEYGSFMFVTGVLLFFLKALPEVSLVIGFIELFGMIAYLFLTTESALKKNFPNQ